MSLTAIHAQNSTGRADNHLFDANFSSRNSGAFNYTLTTLTETYADLTGAVSVNNGEVWDEPEYLILMPFPFELNGHEISFLQFASSGAGLISTTANPDVFVYLLPFETDLMDRGYIEGVSMSPISMKVEGAPGSRILKLEIKNAGSYNEMDANGTLDMHISFQWWLYEGSNKIEFRFGPSSIEDPGLFYGGLSGAFLGLTDVDIVEEVLINPHLLEGNVAAPSLTVTLTPVMGTPANGTVYRLTLDLPIELVVTGVNSTSACAPNGSATVNVTGGTEPYTYAWSNNETTQTIINLDAGIYTVTVTDDNGATASGSVTITNVPPLEANAVSTNETAIGANDGTASATPTGGSSPYAYEWNTGSTLSMIFDLSPGIYTVTVTDAEGCTDEESVTVEAFGCPELLIEASVTDNICFGACNGIITIDNISGGTPPFTYMWSDGSTDASLEGACSGTYSVTVVDSDGCITTDTFTVGQPAQLLANAGSSPETAPDGNDGSAWASPTGGTLPYSYEWSNGSTDSLITGLMPGLYTVIVTDANMCMDTQAVTVDSFGCFLAQAQIQFNRCHGLCEGSITVTLSNVVDPVTYLWSNGDTTASIVNLCAGDYTLTATDAGNCSLVLSFTIIEPEILLANAGSTNETQTGANDGTAWAAPTGGTPPYSYLWNTGSTDSLILGLTPDVYRVTITDANGCVDSQNVVVNEFACVEIQNVIASNATCYNSCDGTISVNATGVGTLLYQWNTGDTTSSIENLCAGIYTLLIYDEGQSCLSDPISFQITQPDSLAINVDEILHLTDSSSTAISVSVTGGTQAYAYAWTGPQGYNSTLSDLTNIEPGFYSLTVTDAQGCTATVDSIEVRDETVGISIIDPSKVRIFPNPATDQIHLETNDIDEYKIQLFTPDGRLISSWENTKTLDVGSLNAGIYLLKLTSGNSFLVHRVVLAR